MILFQEWEEMFMNTALASRNMMYQRRWRSPQSPLAERPSRTALHHVRARSPMCPSDLLSQTSPRTGFATRLASGWESWTCISEEYGSGPLDLESEAAESANWKGPTELAKFFNHSWEKMGQIFCWAPPPSKSQLVTGWVEMPAEEPGGSRAHNVVVCTDLLQEETPSGPRIVRTFSLPS